MGTKKFDPVTLTLVFDLLIENFNLGYILNGVYLDFDISQEIFSDKTCPWVPRDLTL
jgi:hypothetical protein